MANFLEKILPGFGKYIAITIGVLFGYISYRVLSKYDNLTDEQLEVQPMSLRLRILWIGSILAIWLAAYFIVTKI